MLLVKVMKTQDEVIIRNCQQQDIPSLRKLAADTAYFGQPCEYFFPDRELLADFIMEYYVRFEPEHTLVAEYNGDIIGYLSASFDERRCLLYNIFLILPRALIKALIRGKICNKKILRLLWYNLRCILSAQSRLAEINLGRYPVQFHQNIKEGFRGKRVGSRLVLSFLEDIDKRSLGVRFRALRQEKNFGFFERYGFRLHDCRRMPIWEEWLGKTPLYFMEYVRDSKE